MVTVVRDIGPAGKHRQGYVVIGRLFSDAQCNSLNAIAKLNPAFLSPEILVPRLCTEYTHKMTNGVFLWILPTIEWLNPSWPPTAVVNPLKPWFHPEDADRTALVLAQNMPIGLLYLLLKDQYEYNVRPETMPRILLAENTFSRCFAWAQEGETSFEP